MRLTDKVVVITGGTAGLGKELARLFKEEGSTVVISARHAQELKKVARELGIAAYKADVSIEADVHKLFTYAQKLHGRVDIWINNAGAWVYWGEPEDLAMDKVKKMFEVNVYGVMHGFKAVLPYFKKLNAGTILTTVSTSGLMPRPRSTSYAASKWGARGFILSVRERLKETKINILGVYPDGFQSELFRKYKVPNYDTYMTAEYVAKKIIANLKRAKPLLDQKILNSKI